MDRSNHVTGAASPRRNLLAVIDRRATAAIISSASTIKLMLPSLTEISVDQDALTIDGMINVLLAEAGH